MKDNRPVNLDMTTMRHPVTAVASLPHRLTGFLLFAMIPVLLGLLSFSLCSEESFNQLSALLGNFYVKFIVWFAMMPVVYHFVAGCKHLLVDFGLFPALETRQGGKLVALAVLGVSAVLIFALGGWLW